MSDYFDTGFVTRIPAWHNKATVTDRPAANWQEAREWAGLTWEPVAVPTYGFSGVTADGVVVREPGEGVTGDYFEDPGHKRIVRSDSGALLRVAKKSWTPITNSEMGEVVEEILGHGLVVETAGATHGGGRVWGLFLLDEPVTIVGGGRTDISVTLPYMAVMNYHDGNGSMRAGYTMTRIVCANTWQASEGEQNRHGRTYDFRHTANWRDKVEDARNSVQGLRDSAAEYAESMGHLLGIPVTAGQRELFVREFVPMPPDGIISDRVAANVEAARTAVREILASESTAEVADTAYGLVMAATEYLDHVRGYRNRDSLLGRQLLNREPLKEKAAALAQEVALAAV
jgi:phage/plasmid-like protein (TIGR03299 family)